MPFQLKEPNSYQADELDVLELWFDSVTQKQCVRDDSESERLAFWLRPMQASLIDRMADDIAVADRKGSTKMRIGRQTRQKILWCVVRAEGLVDPNGKEITELKEHDYYLLPGWVHQKLVSRINETNDLTEDDEGN